METILESRETVHFFEKTFIQRLKNASSLMEELEDKVMTELVKQWKLTLPLAEQYLLQDLEEAEKESERLKRNALASELRRKRNLKA
jgi:hypothetical protein